MLWRAMDVIDWLLDRRALRVLDWWDRPR